MKTVSIFSIIVLMYIFPAYADVCVPSSNRTLKVVGVASDDTLNARSGFSTNYPVLFELAPNASGIRYLGEKKYKTENCAVLCDQFQNGSSELAPTILRECLKKNRIWYFIQNSDGQYGWVSGKYVEEDEPQLTKVSPARIIPDGKCAIITASFAGEAGALNFLRNQEGNSSPAVLTSKNGNFATVYGIFNLEEGKLRTQQLKTKNMIPTDSYCSQSDRFVDIRFPDPFFANLYYKPSFDCSKAKLPDERAICANSRLAELDQQVASGFRQVQKLKGNDFARNLSRRLLSERKKCGFNFGCIERNQLNAISQYKLYGARLINLDQTDQIVEVNENYSKQDAITYLTILQAYAKLPDNNLDLKFSEKFAAVKPITDGVWNVRLSEAFEALRIHLKGNFAFDKYYENALAKEAARTAAKLEQLSAAIQQEFTALKSWSRNNLLDPRSAEISKLLTAYESADSLNILKLTEILDKAKRLGVSTGTKNDPQASQCSELNLDVCVPDQLCELGTKTVLGQKRWLDNVFYKEAKKLGLSCDVDVPFTQDAAKSYLLQLTDFVSSNGNVFDLSFATEFDKVRAITQGSWSVKLSKDFEQFRLYVEKFPEFQNYIDQKRVLAEAEKKQRVEQLRNAAAQDMTVLKQWAQSNVLDTKAAEIAKLDAKLGEPSLQTIDALEKLVAEVQDLMFSTGVKDVPESVLCAPTNLDACSEIQLCEKATQLSDGYVSWQLNEFAKRAKSLGLTCKVRQTFTQDAAKSYLLQLTDFVSSNGNVFDLSFATEFDKVRAITQGSWSVKLSKDFEQFRLYVEKFPEFQNYIDQKRVLAEAEKKQRVEQLRNAAAQDMTVLKQWAQSNVLDTKAAEIAKLDAKLGEPSLQTIDALEKLVAEVQDLMFSTGVKNAPANAKTQEMVEGLYNPGSIYIFANNSGDAFNLYKAMDGKFTFESGSGTFCASDKLSSLDFYFLREKIFTTFRDLHAVSSNCSIGTDVFLAKGNELTSDRIFDIMAVAGLEKVGEFSRAHRDAAYDQLMYLKKTIKKDVLEGTRMGFGILKSQPNSSKICAIIDENKFGHQEQLEENALLMDAMNLKWNGLEKIVSSSEEAFKFVQRGHCDAIYADALNLGRLYLAGEVASVSFDFIPMWISNNAVEASQKAYDDDMAASAQAKAQAQQSFQDQQILNDQALQSAKELASEQQRALREQHDLRFMVLKDELRRQVFAAVEFGFENPSEQVGYAKKYLSQSFVDPDLRTSPFDEIVRTMQKISSERWEITEQKFDRIDYGSALFKGRSVDAVQVELNISVKNRLIGEFDEYCRRIHAVKDEDFDFWRNISVTDCANEAATSQWRLKNAFQSKWIVEPN